MLKIIENKNEAIELANHLAEQEFVKEFMVGVTGSFMSGLNKKSSSVDIVLKLREGEDKSLIGSVDVLRAIMDYLGVYYHHKFNILWLDLLTEDEEDMINFIYEQGMQPNPESVYTNVVEGLYWVGVDADDDSDEEGSYDSEDTDIENVEEEGED